LVIVRDIDESTFAATLALNNANAAELSFKTEDAFRKLLAIAFQARCTEDGDAFLIAFDHDAAYGGESFAWFRARFARFVYVDRVAVDEGQRGKGIARALYEELIARARAEGHERVLCEVNLVPPNPISDAFHAALGFREIGRGVLTRLEREVRYLALEWD
jgi:predicted GNAT superfamily acetyltransferase